MKIVAFTGIRSDYDLMSPLFKLLQCDTAIDLQLIVSGAHLSQTYGYSVQQIENDGYSILAKIESLIDSDSKSARVKSSAILMQNCVDIVADYLPDLIVFAGDREDVIVASIVGTYLGIPTLHFYSGDHVTDGYVDNPIRHAASKLASAHFTMLEVHKQRLIAIGEDPKRVHVTGNLSLDKFHHFTPLSMAEIEKRMGVTVRTSHSALLIFHPVTEELNIIESIYTGIIEELIAKDVTIFISYPNVDYGNKKIVEIIEKYREHENVIAYRNLEREVFLSIYKQVDFIVGNSSSGICEAASIPIPAINIGTRQEGRFTGKNVIHCKSSKREVGKAIEVALSQEFLTSIASMTNPYGNGKSAEKAYQLIKTIDFDSLLLKCEDPLSLKVSNE